MVVGIIINFVGLHPINALIYSAVLNGLVAPVVLVLIMVLANKKTVMGKFRNGFLTKYFGWLITIIMIVSALITIYYLI